MRIVVTWGVSLPGGHPVLSLGPCLRRILDVLCVPILRGLLDGAPAGEGSEQDQEAKQYHDLTHADNCIQLRRLASQRRQSISHFRLLDLIRVGANVVENGSRIPWLRTKKAVYKRRQRR